MSAWYRTALHFLVAICLKFKLSTAYNTLNERNEILKGQFKTTTICFNWKETAGVFDP